MPLAWPPCSRGPTFNDLLVGDAEGGVHDALKASTVDDVELEAGMLLRAKVAAEHGAEMNAFIGGEVAFYPDSH